MLGGVSLGDGSQARARSGRGPGPTLETFARTGAGLAFIRGSSSWELMERCPSPGQAEGCASGFRVGQKVSKHRPSF